MAQMHRSQPASAAAPGAATTATATPPEAAGTAGSGAADATPVQLDQKYNGLAPGAASASPLPKPNLNTWGSKLMWTGFQMTPGGSRLFFQTSSPVGYDVKPGGKAVMLTLRNCRVHLKNNQRGLDTRYFATPVRAVSLKQRRKDVEIHIGLKAAAAAEPKVEPGPDGTSFVVLDFPPGKPHPANSAGDAATGGQGEDQEERPKSSRGAEAGSGETTN